MNVSYQKLLDRIPYLAWLMTDSGEIVAVNKQWCEYFGCPLVDTAAPTAREERPWLFVEILPQEDRASWGDSWRAANSSQTSKIETQN